MAGRGRTDLTNYPANTTDMLAKRMTSTDRWMTRR
jgi:hypothetical protein